MPLQGKGAAALRRPGQAHRVLARFDFDSSRCGFAVDRQGLGLALLVPNSQRALGRHGSRQLHTLRRRQRHEQRLFERNRQIALQQTDRNLRAPVEQQARRARHLERRKTRRGNRHRFPGVSGKPRRPKYHFDDAALALHRRQFQAVKAGFQDPARAAARFDVRMVRREQGLERGGQRYILNLDFILSGGDDLDQQLGWSQQVEPPAPSRVLVEARRVGGQNLPVRMVGVFRVLRPSQYRCRRWIIAFVAGRDYRVRRRPKSGRANTGRPFAERLPTPA